MANRLKIILPELIGPHTSFVPGRHITKNVIVAQEVKISQKAIKVDLEKAYDRLSLEFIHETRRVIELPQDLIRIIIKCTTTVLMHATSVEW